MSKKLKKFSDLNLSGVEKLAVYNSLEKYQAGCPENERKELVTLLNIVFRGEEYTDEQFKKIEKIYHEWLGGIK